MKEKKLYRGAWKWKNKKNAGHGTWQEDAALVDAWVEDANRKFPEIKHYRQERNVQS